MGQSPPAAHAGYARSIHPQQGIARKRIEKIREVSPMMNRREFIAMAAAASQAFTQRSYANQPSSSPDLSALTLAEASRRIHSGEVTSAELTRQLLDRIKIYNPKINAYITIMHDEALACAQQMDNEAKAGKFRGPLHGIPIALKDNIDTAGTRTTAGSAVFDDRVPEEDAEVVRRLKEAGAVLIGKTNMHEFAAGGSSASTYFGPVRNPWALDRTPAGSSGGSAAAVIADLAYGALGTDKLDVASVEHSKEDYVAAMRQPVSVIRLGIPRAPFFDLLDEETSKLVEEAIGVLCKMTASVSDCHLPATAGFNALALAGEREAYHIELFRRNAQRYTLAVRQNMESAEKTLNDVASEPCSQKVVDYVNSNWRMILMRKSIDDAFRNFDLVALPTMRILPRTIEDSLDREEDIKPKAPDLISNCTPFNIFGLPAISVPCGFSASGLPIGLMIAGPRFSEGKVLALAYAYEQATQWHLKRPVLSPQMTVPPIVRKSKENKT